MGSDDPKTCLEVAMTDAKAPYECVDCCCHLMDWFGHPSESCLTKIMVPINFWRNSDPFKKRIFF